MIKLLIYIYEDLYRAVPLKVIASKRKSNCEVLYFNDNLTWLTLRRLGVSEIIVNLDSI